MRLLHSFRSRFFRQDKPTLHLAVLSPYSNSTTERYINLTIQSLRSATDRTVVVSQYSNIDDAKFVALARDAKEIHFDAILAIGRRPLIQARRLYTEQGIFIPTLLVTHRELIPSHLPKHMSGLVITNNAHMIYEVIKRCFPKISKVLICGDEPILTHVHQVITLKEMFEAHHIDVVSIPLNQRFHHIQELFEQHAPIAHALVVPNDALAFQMMPELVRLAHSYHCSVIASELYSLSCNADIALGYPPEAIAQETAQHILNIIKQPSSRGFKEFKATQEVHCHAGSSIDWLNSLITEEQQYHFKIIGSKDSERSGLNSPPIQRRSAIR